MIFITNNNPMTNLDPYTILELEEGFFNFYLATKNNCLPYPEKGEQFLADYALIDEILSHFLGRKAQYEDYEKLEILELDDHDKNYYLRFAGEVIGGLERVVTGSNYSLKFKKNK
jgi:hypothetical protein